LCAFLFEFLGDECYKHILMGDLILKFDDLFFIKSEQIVSLQDILNVINLHVMRKFTGNILWNLFLFESEFIFFDLYIVFQEILIDFLLFYQLNKFKYVPTDLFIVFHAKRSEFYRDLKKSKLVRFLFA